MGTQELDITSIAPTAIIDPTARIGRKSKIWAFVQVAEHAVIGDDCVIANGAYIDRFVKIGNRVRIHNKALLYHGLVVEDDVFIGPGACFTNDEFPRSGKTRNLSGKSWTIGRGASIGANATVLPDVNIGAYAMIGAGAVVTKNVPPHTVMCGTPAKPVGLACYCGHVMRMKKIKPSKAFACPACGKTFRVQPFV